MNIHLTKVNSMNHRGPQMFELEDLWWKVTGLLCHIRDDWSITASIRTKFRSKYKGGAMGNVPPKIYTWGYHLASPDTLPISTGVLTNPTPIPPSYSSWALILRLALKGFIGNGFLEAGCTRAYCKEYALCIFGSSCGMGKCPARDPTPATAVTRTAAVRVPGP